MKLKKKPKTTNIVEGKYANTEILNLQLSYIQHHCNELKTIQQLLQHYTTRKTKAIYSKP